MVFNVFYLQINVFNIYDLNPYYKGWIISHAGKKRVVCQHKTWTI